MLLFGTGGQLVEVFKDRALALPPLNTTLARRMMEQTTDLQGAEGRARAQAGGPGRARSLLVRFSQLVVEQPWIKEIDINPLLASPEGLVALDARVVVHGPEVTLDQVPKPAIRPYPSRYVSAWTTEGRHSGDDPADPPRGRAAMVKFHETLSERSVYLRYFHLMNLEQRIAHERLTRICFIDYDREMAFVAQTADHEIIGVGRMSKIHGTHEAEVAVLVSDSWQGRGVGRELLSRLLVVGADEKLERLTADILPDNRGVMRICEKLGFSLKHSLDDEVVRAEYKY